MANVSYPQFNLKTIVLPCSIPDDYGGEMSVEDYKNEFGIDIRDILILNAATGEIRIKDDCLILLDFGPQTDKGLSPIIENTRSTYDSGNQDGYLRLYDVPNDGTGNIIEFHIDKDVTFDFEHMQIIQSDF